MANLRFLGLVVLVGLVSSTRASSIGVDFLDANLYHRAERAAHGKHSFTDWFADHVIRRINVVGSEQFGLHLQQTDGDLTAYANSTAFGQGNQTFTNVGQMTITGSRVADLFSFSESFADNRYQDPSARRFSINYNKNGVAVDAGDIYASIVSGNQFASFSRQLRGVDFHVNKGPLTFAGLLSQQNSTATTLSFNGTNSPGPYYLQTSQLNPDTVRVQVDGKELNYPTDFTVNAIIGSITFTTLSVAPTSTIVVSYESTGVNSGGGTISGLGGSYSFGKIGVLGGMVERQTDPSAMGLASFVDRYQGYGDPSVPYILQYTPLASRPIVIALDGVTQTLNVDYQFSAANPTVFYFLRYVPASSTITVTYTPSPASNLRGTRQIEAFNYTLPFGKVGRGGSVTYSQAFSHLSNPVTPMNGTARGVVATYKLKNFSFTTSFDDVPQGYVGIDTTGFQRNELATTTSVEYKLRHFTFNASGANSAVSTQSTDSTGNLIFVPSRTTRLDGGATYRGGGFNWTFNQQHLTSWSVSGPARADETSFSLSKPVGRLNSHLELGHTTGFGPISNGLVSTNGAVRLDSVGWRGDYAASRGWIIGGRTTLSLIDTGGQSGHGTDAQLSVGYHQPTGRFGFDVVYDYSNSGEIATLGQFQDGTGLGYNGNGFSSGIASGTSAAGSTGFNAGGTDIRKFSTTANYVIAKRASIGANFYTSSDFGAVGTNATTTGQSVSIDYDLQNGQRAGMGLDVSHTIFADAAGTAYSLSANFMVGGRPKGPWSYTVGLGTLLSSGGTVAQNSFHYNVGLKHYLKRNQAVGFDIATSNLTNYQPQNDFLINVSYEYQLFKNVSILGKYQIHNVTNLDPTITSGAFRSHGFDIEMNFNFGS